MNNFAPRTGAIGMRTYALSRIDRTQPIWNDDQIVTNLFWKDYMRYYLQRNYVVSNNDLDFLLVSNSGKSYPVEFKSKTVANDPQMGDWFGIDVVEEVDNYYRYKSKRHYICNYVKYRPKALLG